VIKKRGPSRSGRTNINPDKCQKRLKKSKRGDESEKKTVRRTTSLALRPDLKLLRKSQKIKKWKGRRETNGGMGSLCLEKKR